MDREAYSRRAADCLRLANSAQTSREREGYLELADGWRLLAEQAEALERAVRQNSDEARAAAMNTP